jgi:hypothetical protein
MRRTCSKSAYFLFLWHGLKSVADSHSHKKEDIYIIIIYLTPSSQYYMNYPSVRIHNYHILQVVLSIVTYTVIPFIHSGNEGRIVVKKSWGPVITICVMMYSKSTEFRNENRAPLTLLFCTSSSSIST